jgi:hypothetical protein
LAALSPYRSHPGGHVAEQAPQKSNLFKKDFENEFLLHRRNPFSREMDFAILEEECRSQLADRGRFPPG